jgi:hypothetical protein
MYISAKLAKALMGAKDEDMKDARCIDLVYRIGRGAETTVRMYEQRDILGVDMQVSYTHTCTTHILALKLSYAMLFGGYQCLCIVCT